MMIAAPRDHDAGEAANAQPQQPMRRPLRPDPRRRSGAGRSVRLRHLAPLLPMVGLALLVSQLLLLLLLLLLQADTSAAADSSSSSTSSSTAADTIESSSSSSAAAATTASAAGGGRLYPLPLPPPGLPPPIFPTFGPSRGCGPTGSRVYKAGAYCYPFHKFTIGSILASPAFRGCCRPCPEQFGLELGLLEASEAHKARAWTRFHRWAASRTPAGTTANAHTASPAMHEAALLQTEIHMRAAKGGGGDAKGGSAGGAIGSAAAGLGGGAGAKGGAAPGAGAAKAGDAAKGGSAAGAKGGGDTAKAGASAKAAKISPATGGGMAPDTPPPAMPPAPNPTEGYRADANSFGSPSIGFGLMMGTATHGGVTGMSTGGFVSGPQAEKLLPCCKVCPEQFLMPETLSDLSTTFVEVEEDETDRLRKGRRGFMGAAAGGMAGGMMGGGMGGMGPPPNAGGNGPTSMDTGYVRGTCCNMCDKQTTKGQRFLELLSTAKLAVTGRLGRKRGGDASASASSASARLVVNSRRRGFMGAAGSMLGNAAMSGMGSMHGNTGGCCPVCPNLQTVMNAGVPQDEAFGGPFAKAQGIDLDTAAGEPLTPEEKHALKELADLAGMDHVTAARDPGMLEAARSRAQSALAGMLGGAGMMAAGAALGSLRL